MNETTKINHRNRLNAQTGEDGNVKNLLVDYQVSVDCINSDSYGAVCVKCGRCGRIFTKDGFLKESDEQ